MGCLFRQSSMALPFESMVSTLDVRFGSSILSSHAVETVRGGRDRGYGSCNASDRRRARHTDRGDVRARRAAVCDRHASWNLRDRVGVAMDAHRNKYRDHRGEGLC